MAHRAGREREDLQLGGDLGAAAAAGERDAERHEETLALAPQHLVPVRSGQAKKLGWGEGSPGPEPGPSLALLHALS